MGVEFFPCDDCGDSICDAGDWWSCEECGAKLCIPCARSQGLDGFSSEDGDECPFCAGDLATDANLLGFALGRLGMTVEELKAAYSAHLKAQ